MKKKLPFIILAALTFLAALGLTLYPLISTAYNERHRSEIHTHYEEQIMDNDRSQLLSEKKKALPENQSMWNDVLYGLCGQGVLVAVALSQVGNVGGETYWRWYGFDERVDWCAIFISWCAMSAATSKAVLSQASLSAMLVRIGSNLVNSGKITPTRPALVILFSSIGTTLTKAVKMASPTMSASSKKSKTAPSTP